MANLDNQIGYIKEESTVVSPEAVEVQTQAVLESQQTRRGAMKFLFGAMATGVVAMAKPAEAGWRNKSVDGRPEDHSVNLTGYNVCVRGNCAENIPDKEKGGPLTRGKRGTECEGEFYVEGNGVEIDNGECRFPGGNVVHYKNGHPIDPKTKITVKTIYHPPKQSRPKESSGKATSEGVFTGKDGKFHNGHCSDNSFVKLSCNPQFGGYACSASGRGRGKWSTDEYEAARKACRS